MAKDVIRATSWSLCDASPCDLRIHSVGVDEAHLASIWSTCAPVVKLDCSTTPKTLRVITCSTPGIIGPSVRVFATEIFGGLDFGLFGSPLNFGACVEAFIMGNGFVWGLNPKYSP